MFHLAAQGRGQNCIPWALASGGCTTSNTKSSALCRIVRSHGNLTMFGIGWLEGELLDEFVPSHR